MREDPNVPPVQSTPETSRGHLEGVLRTRNLLGAATAVAALLVLTTGDVEAVYPVVGAVCVVWGLKAAVTASLAPNE